MVFICDCGKRFRAPDGTSPTGHVCPSCSGILRPAGLPGSPAMDVGVIIEQKKALRDELRVRDRQLRIAHGEIQRLKAENEKLRSDLSRTSPATANVIIAEAPVVVDRGADWRPLELPSERVDWSNVPLLEELPDLAGAPQLPSDRLPLYGPKEE